MQVGLRLKDIYGTGRSIELIHRWQTEQEFHRTNQTNRTVEFVHQHTRFVVGTDYQRHGSMRIHVVRSILRVIFDDEDCCIFPI